MTTHLARPDGSPLCGKMEDGDKTTRNPATFDCEKCADVIECHAD